MSSIPQEVRDKDEEVNQVALPTLQNAESLARATNLLSGGILCGPLQNVNIQLAAVAGLASNPLVYPALAASFGPVLPPVTHNLIPLHLQSAAAAASLNGTPGYQPALIQPYYFEQQILPQPAYTVQDRPLVAPVYNGVNPMYPGLRVVNVNPPIFAVDNFLTPYECNFLVQAAHNSFGPAPVVGKGAGEISPSRTSSTCYLAREDLPDYLRKVSFLTGKPIGHCELPQVGRYFPSQQYKQHFDAFDLSNEDGCRFAANGGQRTVTVLVYLNDVIQGGSTAFPALNIEVKPRQGTALIFFPATVDGLLDKMTLHAALPAVDTKYVSQVWIRQGEYNGNPSKRLPKTLGPPFGTIPGLQY